MSSMYARTVSLPSKAAGVVEEVPSTGATLLLQADRWEGPALSRGTILLPIWQRWNQASLSYGRPTKRKREHKVEIKEGLQNITCVSLHIIF
ncbi:hypothetical protein AXF42_Ash019507 [Apostasia shenzhenica]|uniref:Uncharacterized protein n=1 Tax=Apostasia shenzhenica TaxID=1088818 RepID=A0A2I0A0A2_9ASPA|nr:hypothetical protein AXF42_Ash019507 [Apostasia shenzhenica]